MNKIITVSLLGIMVLIGVPIMIIEYNTMNNQIIQTAFLNSILVTQDVIVAQNNVIIEQNYVIIDNTDFDNQFSDDEFYDDELKV